MKTIKYNNYEWYVIEEDEETLTLFLNRRLNKEEIIELFDESVLDEFKDVKYGLINNTWQDSIIRFVLNSKWLSKFNKDELVLMEHNDGRSTTNDYIRLLSKEEAEKLPRDVLKVDDEYGYWLASADDDDYVWIVASDGGFDYDAFGSDYGYGVRPVLKIYKSNAGSEFSEKIGSAKIEKLDICDDNNTTSKYLISIMGNKCYMTKHSEIIANKINEIIDYINKKED